MKNLKFYAIEIFHHFLSGGGEVPKAFSGRVIVATYWLFVVLMLATFTANLAGINRSLWLLFLYG